MTSNDITRMLYAAAIGGLASYSWGLAGILLGVAIIIVANLVGFAFGSDR